MSAFSLCLVLVGLVRVCGGVYLYLPSKTTQPQALAQCQRYGMTLLELRSQAQLDRWNHMKSSLFRLVQPWTPDRQEPWLGLKHTGNSNEGKQSNYRWLDAGAVTFLTWPANTSEPDLLPQDACIRVRTDHFGTRSCDHFGYSTACQESEFSGQKGAIPVYRRYRYNEIKGQTSSYYRLEPLRDPHPQLWLLARPPLRDVIYCVLQCQNSGQDCQASLHPDTGCTVLDTANLTHIHAP